MIAYANGERLALTKDIVNPNLLANTLQADDNSNWFFPAGTVDWNEWESFISPYYSLAKIFEFMNNGNTGTAALKTNIIVNGTYTFSFMFAEGRDANTPNEAYKFSVSATVDGEEITLGQVNVPTTKKWQKFAITFTASGKMTDIRFNVIDGLPGGHSALNGWKLERGTVATDWCPAYDDYAMSSDVEKIKVTNDKPWAGKAITCLGDSFTHGPASAPNLVSYVARMAKWLGTTPTNVGVGGATLASGNAGRGYIGDQVKGVINQDVVTIFGGTNDFAAGSQIGSMKNTVDDKNTIYGSLKYMITTLAKQNPDAKFLLMTPAKSTLKGWATYNSDGTEAKNGAGFTVAQYVNAIKDIGAYYSIPVLDIFTMGNYNPILQPNLSLEGLHPNDEGFERLAKTIADRINNL